MRKSEVPQDSSSLKENNFKELCYAVDEKGEYTTALSSGWTPKTIALSNSIDRINEEKKKIIQDIKEGTKSPIAYYMVHCKMDLNILNNYTGIWKWRIKRHLKVKGFNRLKPKTLQKYATVFQISIEQLKNPMYE